LVRRLRHGLKINLQLRPPRNKRHHPHPYRHRTGQSQGYERVAAALFCAGPGLISRQRASVRDSNSPLQIILRLWPRNLALASGEHTAHALKMN
jgi:hypothetical protein